MRRVVACAVAMLAWSASALAGIDVYFSPRGGATEAVIAQLANAKSEILVQAYSFTSAPIAEALVKAHRRGVKVSIVLDKSQGGGKKYGSADFVAHAGVPTYLDRKHAIAHNKVIVIDRANIVTGSFNFTKAAEERNAENLLVITGDAVLAKKYALNFKIHESHSDRYAGR